MNKETEGAERIHEASLALLENPGVKLEHDGIVETLLKAGAQAGAQAQVIRLPRKLVMECVEQAPAEVLFAARHEGGAVVGPQKTSKVWSAPGMNILRHGKHRPFTRFDMADMARLIGQLPHIDGVFGMSMDDVPPQARDFVGLRIMAENTAKHIRVLSFTPEGADAVCAMRDVVDNSPWLSMGFTAHGPLRWTHLALEIFSRTAGKGIPVSINGEPMAGVSGPVTLAGAAAVGNAEILAGLVVNQLLEPGRPCVYNLGLAHIFDMRTAIAVTGAPENHLFADLSAAMGRFYDLPSCSWVSTESMCVDAQAAMEKGIGFTTHLQSGVSLIWGAGQLESELTLSTAQAVIDNEILAYLERYRRGVDFSPEALAVEVTREIGISGNYLEHEHTFENFRSGLFQPSILFRMKRSAWEEQGSPTLYTVAEAKADELIAQPLPPILSEDRQAALREIENSFLKQV